MMPALAEAVSRRALVMATYVATYRLRAAFPLLLELATGGALYVRWMIAFLAVVFPAGAGQGPVLGDHRQL